MKKLTLSLMIFLAAFVMNAQHVDFYKGSWEEANDKAKAENKFIFLDAYTDWCAWCKVMDKEMFTDPEVAPFINDNFIPLKINFEETFGQKLAAKFRVMGFPTTLIFNPEGQLVTKIEGYNDNHKEYRQELQDALNIKKANVFPFDSKELEPGFPEFYLKSFAPGKERVWPSDSIVNDYLEQQQDLFSEVNWSILYKFQPKEYMSFFRENYDKYLEMYGRSETESYLSDIIYFDVQKAIQNKSIDELEIALELCNKLSNAEIQKFSFRLLFYEKTGDWEGYAAEIESYIKVNGYEDHMMVNNASWTIYEKVNDKKILKMAAGWMEQVVANQPKWMYLDTYAALLYKSGDLKQAESIAVKAIETGKKEGEDVSETQKLLDKIKEAK